MVNYIQKHYQWHIGHYNFLFDDLMYRVNALRELFEETGILLYRECDSLKNDNNASLSYPMKARMHCFNNDRDAVTVWRQKVLDDPFKFEELYRSMECVPDIL